MTIDKNITVDLNRVQPLKTIQIHEGDTNSVRLVFTLTKDSADVDLSSVSIRYDAVIGDYLAEQDAPGSIEDGKAVVPVTANMTARSGILKVDVKLVEGDSVLFTQTIKLLVERSVINGDTIIDISGTTIDQKLDQLTLQFEGFENNYYTKAEVDAELEKRYTKTETDNLLKGKVKYEYHQGIHAEDLDTYTDAQTLYRIYYEGTYQFLICTSGTGGQFRFTKFGDIFYRVYNMGSNTWGEWNKINGSSEITSLSGEKLIDGTVSDDKLIDEYFRLFINANLDEAGSFLKIGVYTGRATASWQTDYGITGKFVLFHEYERQLLYFEGCNRTFIRTRAMSNYPFEDWVEITPITEGTVNTIIDTKLGSYYTKTETDAKLADRMKVKTQTLTNLNQCDSLTDPDTLYQIKYAGVEEILLNTSNSSGQLRLNKNGYIYFRNYNASAGTWSEWTNAMKNIPPGTITTAMIGRLWLPYDNLDDHYIRYFDYTELGTMDELTDYGIYTGITDETWRSQYGVDGHYLLLVTENTQLLMFPLSNHVFTRERPNNGAWGDWTDISPATEAAISTIAGEVADSKLTKYYTKAEMNSKLSEKENIFVNTNAQLSDCDNYYATETLYRLIINGQEHLLVNAGSHATQFRFTNGEVFVRRYRNRTWDEWQNLLTQIPDGAITGDMIQQLTIPADRLEDIYPALHYADEIGGEGDINDWSNGIYIGTLTENWRARYGVSGHYILIADGMQIMYIPEANRVQFRERGHMGRWDSWEVIDLCSYAVVHREVHGESGYISENYAWYTDPSQGLSLSGTYTLVGDFCTINGTVPLIEGWETVYYSLPCNSLFSACTVARCGNDVFTVATNTLDNVSVIEIKKIGGGTLPSGTLSFTLTYRYFEPEIGG